MTAPMLTSRASAADRRSASTQTLHFTRGSASSCSDCVACESCVGARLTALTDGQAVGLVRHNHTLGLREHLFREGDSPEALYIVKSGAVKLYLSSEDGGEQVVAFYMPGEVLGLDALGMSAHRSSAIALERASFCVIPLTSLERAPQCHRLLYQLLSRELVRDHHTIELITKKDAEAKIASFLVDLSRRFRARGYSASHFNLSMKRNEIGSYLGLAVETVSRILTRFQDEGLLRVQRRQVQIVNFGALEKLAGYQASPCEPEHRARAGAFS